MGNKIPRVGQVVRNKENKMLFAVVEVINNEDASSTYTDKDFKLINLQTLKEKSYDSNDFKDIMKRALRVRISNEKEYKDFIKAFTIHADTKIKIEEVKTYKISIGQVER